ASYRIGRGKYPRPRHSDVPTCHISYQEIRLSRGSRCYPSGSRVALNSAFTRGSKKDPDTSLHSAVAPQRSFLWRLSLRGRDVAVHPSPQLLREIDPTVRPIRRLS